MNTSTFRNACLLSIRGRTVKAVTVGIEPTLQAWDVYATHTLNILFSGAAGTWTRITALKGRWTNQLFDSTIKLSVSQNQLPSNCHWYITKVKLGYSHLLILFESCPNKTQRVNNGVYGSRTRFSTLTTWREKPFLQYSIQRLFFSKRKVIVFLTLRFVSYLITK